MRTLIGDEIRAAGMTVEGCRRIHEILEGKKLSTVCGVNYVVGYDDWKRRFSARPLFNGY